MTLTALDLLVAIDTLKGSCSMRDGGTLFSYSEKARMEVIDKMAHVLEKVEIGVVGDDALPVSP